MTCPSLLCSQWTGLNLNRVFGVRLTRQLTLLLHGLKGSPTGKSCFRDGQLTFLFPWDSLALELSFPCSLYFCPGGREWSYPTCLSAWDPALLPRVLPSLGQGRDLLAPAHIRPPLQALSSVAARHLATVLFTQRGWRGLHKEALTGT